MPVKQPIHPSMLPKLDPQYIAFHNTHIAHLTPPHTLPWDPAIRALPNVPGGSDPLPVQSIVDYEISTNTKVRVYTPEGEAPTGGWPALLFFHGGGWTLGGIGSEAAFCTKMAVRKCDPCRTL